MSQIDDLLTATIARSATIKAVAVTVIEENGSVTTSTSFPTDQAMALLGALDISKDHIKAGLTVGPAPT